MYDTAENKRSIRREIRRRMTSLTPVERLAASRTIFDAVEREPAFIEARTVALFASLADEPQTDLFLRRWHGVKRLLLPRVADGDMEFCDYAPDGMRRGAYGIAEPVSDVCCLPADIDFMVVPGVAFTPDGGRLGRGGGYYDRYMSREGFRAFRAGVCFAVQCVDRLPLEPHDLHVDRLFVG